MATIKLKYMRNYKIPRSLFVFLVCTVPGVAHAAYGLEETAAAAGLGTGVNDIPTLVGNILGIGLSLVAVLFFILMLYGGFLWMFDMGSEDRKKRALNTITAAVIGIIVVMASYTITSFVFNSVTPSNSGEGIDRGLCVPRNSICFDSATEETCDPASCAWTQNTNGGAGGICVESTSACLTSYSDQGSCVADAACEWRRY